MMNVKINGQEETVESGTTMGEVLRVKGINPNVVACEVNLKIVRRAQLGETVLRDGDEVEIIQMVGGG